MKYRIACVAILAAALLGSVSTATAATLPAPVRAAEQALGHAHTTGQLQTLIKRSTPARRKLILSLLTPARYTTHITTTITIKKGTAHASSSESCPYFSNRKNITITASGAFGYHLFDYYTDWQWSGMCWVHAANHQENGGNTALGWTYVGSTYGVPYGGLNSPMIGRQTFGRFNFVTKVVQQDTVDSQVKVYGWWGYYPAGEWNWDNIT